LETETKTRILAGGLNTTRQQMLRLDRGNRAPLPAKAQEELAQLLDASARDSAAVLVSDYGAGVCGEGCLSTLRTILRSGTPVSADSRFSLRSFMGMTVCKPNEPELAALTGLPVQTDEQLTFAARRGLQLLECQTLLVTRGRHGAAVFSRSGEAHLLPAHGMQDAVDVTGAGDTVIAAFTLAMACGATPLQAAELANIAGAIVVQKQGTATVSQQELFVELER
jgi:rfaE bifunctional protein kinase chain/domain